MYLSCSRYKPHDIIQVKEKSQLFPSKKIEFLFPHAEFVLFCFQNRQYRATKNADPQTCFTGMKKVFQSSFGFWTLMEGRKPSKSTYKHQSCSRYKPYDVIQVKEKSQLSLPKKLNFFFPHAEFFVFCFQNRLS